MFSVRQIILVGSLLIVYCLGSGGFSKLVFANEEKDYKNIEIFTDVLSLVRSSYVEDVDMNKLIYGAIRGMLDSLDPHSSFLTPEMYMDMQADTHGEFGGLGIEITVKDHALIVVTPIEDTPADKVGIKVGDQIVMINGHPTRDMEIMQAIRLMRGPKGEAITITIHRPGLKGPLDFTIVRDIIQLQSVKSSLLDGRYGYVRVSQFQDRTGSDLKDHLTALREKNTEGLQGMILDLRNNPGGLLDQAVAVADLFLAEKVPLHKVIQIGARSLGRNLLPSPVRISCVLEPRVSERMSDQSSLSMIQISHPFKTHLEAYSLLSFSFNESTNVINRALEEI